MGTTGGETAALGQAFEFRLWSELTARSGGRLHVFLPLLDAGVDGVLHRLTDGAYICVQAKCRASERNREVHVVIKDEELADDGALVIAGRLQDGELGPSVLAVPAGEFKRLAYHWAGLGGRYEAWFHDEPGLSNRWTPYVVRWADLPRTLLGPAAAEAPEPGPAVAPGLSHDRWLGFLGESEVIRRLAGDPRLELYRPFPDREFVEVLARHHTTRRFAGLQVKAPAWSSKRRAAHAGVPAATLRADPQAWLVVLMWLPDAEAFHDECLLIPAGEVARLAVREGDEWAVEFRLPGGRGTRYDPYRVPLAELAARVGALLGEPLTSPG